MNKVDDGTASWTPAVLDCVMDRSDPDCWWDRRLALFCSTELRSPGIVDRRLGHHCLAWRPCYSVLACWSISIELSAPLAANGSPPRDEAQADFRPAAPLALGGPTFVPTVSDLFTKFRRLRVTAAWASM